MMPYSFEYYQYAIDLALYKRSTIQCARYMHKAHFASMIELKKFDPIVHFTIQLICPQMSLPDQHNVKQYESKLDLDFDNFLTKKIDRCNVCGDIFYAGVQPPHACSNKQRPLAASPGNNLRTTGLLLDPSESASENASAIESQQSSMLDSASTSSVIHDKIYDLWKSNGFPRHKKTSVPAESGSDEHSKDNFSFSPYDNFFQTSNTFVATIEVKYILCTHNDVRDGLAGSLLRHWYKRSRVNITRVHGSGKGEAKRCYGIYCRNSKIKQRRHYDDLLIQLSIITPGIA